MANQPLMDLSKIKAARSEKDLAAFPISEVELCERYEALFSAAVNVQKAH